MIAPICILIIVCGLGLKFPRRKVVTLLLLLFLWGEIALCSRAPDLENYAFMYENINSPIFSTFEPGFLIIAKVCKKCALSFYQFRGVVSAVFLLVLLQAFKRLTKNINKALSLSIIFPCIGFASGFRTCIAFALSCYAFTFLIAQKKYGTLKFAIFIFLATIFHYSSIINIIFLLGKKRITLTQILGLLILEFLFFIMLFKGILFNIAQQFISSEKILSWASVKNYEHPGIVVGIGVITVMLLSGILVYRNLNRTDNQNLLRERTEVLVSKNIIKLCLLLLPFLMLNLTFERFFYAPIMVTLTQLTAFPVKEKLNRACVFVSVILNILFFLIVNKNLYFPIIYHNKIWEHLFFLR